MNKTMDQSPRVNPDASEKNAKSTERAVTARNSPPVPATMDAAHEQQIKLLFRAYDLQKNNRCGTQQGKDAAPSPVAPWSQPTSAQNIFGSQWQCQNTTTDGEAGGSKQSSRQRGAMATRFSKLRRLSQDDRVEQRDSRERLSISTIDQKKTRQTLRREGGLLSPKWLPKRVDRVKFGMS